MPTRKKTRKHGQGNKFEERPPSDARPPVDYRDEAVRAIHAHRPRYDDHV